MMVIVENCRKKVDQHMIIHQSCPTSRFYHFTSDISNFQPTVLPHENLSSIHPFQHVSSYAGSLNM